MNPYTLTAGESILVSHRNPDDNTHSARVGALLFSSQYFNAPTTHTHTPPSLSPTFRPPFHHSSSTHSVKSVEIRATVQLSSLKSPYSGPQSHYRPIQKLCNDHYCNSIPIFAANFNIHTRAAGGKIQDYYISWLYARRQGQ